MLLESLKHSLIVSCQPVPGGAMDDAQIVAGFALAALEGGASALRIESVPYVAAVRKVTDAPIIGIVKRDLADSPVRITPFVADAEALIEAGADIVAFDATGRTRPQSVADIVAAIHARGALAMADCARLEDARMALSAGADCVGSTLSGYTGGAVPKDPDFALVAAMRKLTPFVIAEGRIHSPQLAAEAIRRGAFSVVAGSAITRTEHVTSWFRQEIEKATAEMSASPDPASDLSRTVLSIDIGGTKILATLIKNGWILREAEFPTEPGMGPDCWIAAIADRVADWRGNYGQVAVAATGLIHQGHWSALNPATLAIPDAYPLEARLRDTFGVAALAINDAQAAAWGEYRRGAGNGKDMVFLTISTGIGGGVIVNGQLLQGMAGHFGQWRSPSGNSREPLEDQVSGHFMASEAAKAGHAVLAPDIFAAAREGEAWASAIIAASAKRVALLCQDIQFALDPATIVIGGGIGLADGYIDRVRSELSVLKEPLRPVIASAKLGRYAGVIGAADLAITRSVMLGNNK